MKIGFKDKNGTDLRVGQMVKTYDKTGKVWVGQIVIVDPRKVIKGNNPQYAFSANYETWISKQEYASTLEIIT